MARSLLEVQVGGITVDVPRSLGYFGGVAVAVGVGLVDPPVGVFIAAVPLIKALTNRSAPVMVRLVGEILEGGAKPVGGDADAVVRVVDDELADERAAALADEVNRGRSVRRARADRHRG